MKQERAMRMALIREELVDFYNFVFPSKSAVNFEHLSRIVRDEYRKKPEEEREKFPSVADWAAARLLRLPLISMEVSAYDILAEMCGKNTNEEYTFVSSPTCSLVKKSWHFVRPYIQAALQEL